MAKSDVTYGTLIDGTPLTDEAAKVMVDDAFDALSKGKGKALKTPAKQIRIKASIRELPPELQEAALYR